MVEYPTSLNGVRTRDLAGFFVGWPSPPNQDEHRVLDEIGDLYGVDVCCDDAVAYYQRFGFQRVNGMVLRPHLKPRVTPAG